MFKKKTLKFHYEKVSRDLRHAETVKARESSRFKRLSTLRSINDSDLNDDKSMETAKESKLKAPEAKKPSRLEMLFKWKQEKQIKKEMEKMMKKKPFYTGGNKNVIENKSFKTSFVSHSNSSSFNSSKFIKSKLVTPNAIVQPARILNAKQGTPGPGTIIQSKIPNSKQGTPSSTFQSSRIPNSKQGAFTATSQLSKIAVSKQTNLPKTGSNLSRSNSTATLSRKLPLSASSSSADKTGSNLIRSNTTTNAATARKFPISSSAINSNKAGTNLIRSNSNATISKRPPFSSSTINKNNNKGPSEFKFITKRQEEKPVKKIGTGLSKLTSNVAAIPKGIPTQNKLPVSNVKKLESNPKQNLKDVPQQNNISSRKGYCFRTAIANSTQKRTDVLKTPMQGTPKKPSSKTLKGIQQQPLTEEIPEQNLDCIPDVTFNSDISIIKPARTSFAPNNFTFQPPEGLNNFTFDDDGDIFQSLEEIKQIFMSRTSTPSKDSGGKSSIRSSKESLGSDLLKTEVEKASDMSNSNDIQISELMSPMSFKVKTNIEETDETSVKHDLTSNTEIKEADNCVNQQACDEVASVSPIKTLSNEIDVIANQENEELPFNSPVPITTEEIDISPNQEAFGNLISISPTKTDINTDKSMNQQTCEEISDIKKILSKAETAEEKTDSELQKSLHDEKELLFDHSENPKENTVEVSNNEPHSNPSLKNGSSESSVKETLFFDDDDDFLLDSIDLNKIQLMKLDDEDTDEDRVPSPQVLKCPERKSNGTIPKRVSMLKKLTVMNSISENIETDEHTTINLDKSAKNKHIRNTPRCSKRTSTNVSVDVLCDSPLKNSVDSPNVTTPRRSLRLMKLSSANDEISASPFQEKRKANIRRSVKLIDLNTPEKAACGKILGKDLENLDPNDFLIDFESPGKPALSKSKKVSLLYSPERRKSTRKSIRGDLMSFSPI